MGDLFDLSGKTVLVTGASSGIGREIAIAASNQGASVIMTGRDVNRLEETNSALRTKGLVLVADLTKETEISAMVEQLPSIDGVVFNAGVIDYTPLKFINYQKIDTIFSVNFQSQVMLTQKLVKKKKINKGGSLVYISSISSKLGVPATAIYATSKGAINAYMRVVAAELSGQKIRANSICPGLIRTPMLEGAASTITADSFVEAEKDYPLGIGEPSDVAGPVMFLLSEAGKWITGTEIVADGGLTLR